MNTRLAALTLLVLLLIGLLPASAQETEIRLVLTSRYADPPRLYTSQTGGTDIQPFGTDFEEGGEIVSISQSPDLSKIAYISRKDRDGIYPTNELFVYDLESGQNTQLTNDGLEKGYVNWLPDSTTLVYLARGLEGQYDEIRSLTLPYREMQTTVTDQSVASEIDLEMIGLFFWGIDISPDGTKLVAWVQTGLPEAYSILIMMNVDGTNIQRLTSNEELVGLPVWGSTSNYVYFDRTSGDYPSDIYSEVDRINIDTMVVETLVSLRDIAADGRTRLIIVLDITSDDHIIWQLISSPNLYVYDLATNQTERIPLHTPTEVELLGWIELPS